MCFIKLLAGSIALVLGLSTTATDSLRADVGELQGHSDTGVSSSTFFVSSENYIEKRSGYVTVLYAKGKSIHKGETDKEWKIVSRQMKTLSLSNELQTGHDGFVSLQLPTGKFVNVQPNSLVNLSVLFCTTVSNTPDRKIEKTIQLPAKVELSTACTNKKISDQLDKFQILIPYASAAVRG